MIRTTFKKFSSKVLKKRTNKFWNSLASLLLFQVNDMISTIPNLFKIQTIFEIIVTSDLIL